MPQPSKCMDVKKPRWPRQAAPFVETPISVTANFSDEVIVHQRRTAMRFLFFQRGSGWATPLR